ncbi:hypothetical protein [Streptomyces sp. NBC_01455]|uniref:hypothetical protein n=1 Tax=Streptomyces sp. NBC_01455 TaxID=2903874 RepID=UPI002E3299F8|nr:hypothetical protein [Streptomyces sp. NBC_01455]
MPTALQQLSAHRELSALRAVLECPQKASALREGAAVDSGTGPAWLVFLCSEQLPGWPDVRTHDDHGSMPCGSVLDYRPTEQLLQSHADLWLTPLTGVDPAAYGGAWSDVLDQADRALLARAEREAGSEDSPLQSMLTIMGMACWSAAEGDLKQAAVALGYCETIALSL